MTSDYDCIIAGGGPAGMMTGLLLARAGCRVCVLEKHPDFFHDFRGDTIHPATLALIDSLGWLDEFLALPHQKAAQLHAEIAGAQVTIADFSRLKTACPYIVFMPQWDFLDFLARKASALPGFELRMGHQITGLLQSQGKVRGVSCLDAGGQPQEITAPLVIGADGRNSVVRQAAGLRTLDFGSPVDVLWFRLSRLPDDPAPAMSHAGPAQGLVLIDRGDFWQCGYVIRKGSWQDVQENGLPALRAALAALSPLPAARLDELTDWSQLHLLSIRMDRLEKWWAPGVLCIGDAAHAMSPVGGFGVNLAIQDAVAAANILGTPLREGRLQPRDLARVQARRLFPTRATQGLQKMMRRKRKPDGQAAPRPPGFLRLIARWPFLSRWMGRLIGMGFRPEKLSAQLRNPLKAIGK
ncbi:FAD-dependent oxidoreductase [Xinfangfangia sp. D13-10-4-6]|uniref:FAD-dependent oxidoreductase n=1 Tax=Pseudogemmobacter hezensis TaxID=2737662 RepID=UPI0015521F3F|nr:FAD-dependent oxidoreductase [Pseudogemmobacter hezensis]NPD16478.1 FAD-dependent oxidoreductase [Pseudogemmobacter hezensis]